MATRLTFLCAGATAASRIAAFPSPDEPLDDGGARKAAAFDVRGPRPDLIVSSPSRAAIETANAIGLHAAIEPEVADLDFGDWSGRTLPDLEDREAPALMAWLADPTRATPGGEAMAELVARVGGWMDRHAGSDRNLFAVSHAAVVRAAIAHSLSAPVASIMRVDVAPLAALELSFNGQWRLQELRRIG
jgi:broad specificity phosphatase PhoE